jgi:hypothetical protein
MLLLLSKLLGILGVILFHELYLLPGLGITLVIFYVMLNLLSLGLTMGIG